MAGWWSSAGERRCAVFDVKYEFLAYDRELPGVAVIDEIRRAKPTDEHVRFINREFPVVARLLLATRRTCRFFLCAMSSLLRCCVQRRLGDTARQFPTRSAAH